MSRSSPRSAIESPTRLRVYRGLLRPVRFFGLFPSTLLAVLLFGFTVGVWVGAASNDPWLTALAVGLAVSGSGMVLLSWETARPSPPWRRVRAILRPRRYTAHPVVRR